MSSQYVLKHSPGRYIGHILVQIMIREYIRMRALPEESLPRHFHIGNVAINALSLFLDLAAVFLALLAFTRYLGSHCENDRGYSRIEWWEEKNEVSRTRKLEVVGGIICAGRSPPTPHSARALGSAYQQPMSSFINTRFSFIRHST